MREHLVGGHGDALRALAEAVVLVDPAAFFCFLFLELGEISAHL